MLDKFNGQRFLLFIDYWILFGHLFLVENEYSIQIKCALNIFLQKLDDSLFLTEPVGQNLDDSDD